LVNISQLLHQVFLGIDQIMSFCYIAPSFDIPNSQSANTTFFTQEYNPSQLSLSEFNDLSGFWIDPNDVL